MDRAATNFVNSLAETTSNPDDNPQLINELYDDVELLDDSSTVPDVFPAAF
jgi:hypothetical protein